MSDLARLGSLVRLAGATVADPREGANTVLAFAPPREALWLMFALVIVVTSLLGAIVTMLAGPLPDPQMQEFSPIWLGVLQGALLFIMVHAIHRVGSALGGTGRFEEALLLVIWLQFIFICVQLLQLGLMLVLPAMAPIITLLSIALFFWLLVNFIAVLHGFTSLGKVFAMVVAVLIGVAFALSLVLSMLGLTFPQGAL